jgi:hypothetical protein
MSFETYKVVHLLGIFMILMPLAAIVLHVMQGGERRHAHKRSVAVVHGIGMLFSIVSGFGMLARMGSAKSIPTWAWFKLGIWVVLGAMIGMLYRSKHPKFLGLIVLLLATLASSLAIFKP